MEFDPNLRSPTFNPLSAELKEIRAENEIGGGCQE
jgi:hypothetical protein